MYYYYVYITMIVYFLTDVMKWLRGKWNQLMKLVIPVWSSIGQDFCVPSMHNREFKFGYQHFLLCQKSFLKVSSKWLLKNKSDNGKLLVGKNLFRWALQGHFGPLVFISVIFSSTGHRRTYVMVCCPSCVRPSVRPCVNFFFKHFLLWFWWNFTEMFLPWSSSELLEKIWFCQKLWLLWQQNWKKIWKLWKSSCQKP